MAKMTKERLEALGETYSRVRRLTQREELELLEAVQSAQESEEAKDAQIEALADALESERHLTGANACECRDTYICVTCKGASALRLAGRLK